MNSRTKKVLLVLGLAAPILCWRVYGLLDRYLPASVQASPVSDPVADPADHAKTDAAKDDSARWEAQRAVAEQPWGRDPFAQPIPVAEETKPRSSDVDPAAGSSAPPAAALGFTGISNSKGNWLAVIRGRIVRVGDDIDGKYKVIAIDRRSITLAAGAWTYRYQLGSDEVLVRPASEEQ